MPDDELIGDAEASEENAAEDQKSTEPKADAGDSEAGGAQEQGDFIPKPAFDKVWGKLKGAESRLKKYSDFGDPDAVSERLARLEAYEKRIEEYRNQQALSEDERNAAAAKQRIYKQLLEVAPELKSIGKIEELEKRLNASQEFIENQAMEAASSHLGNLLKTKGIQVDTQTQDNIEDLILLRIGEEGKAALRRRDFSAIDSTLGELLKSQLFSGLDRPDGAQGVQASSLPKRQKPGGTTAKPKTKGPRTFDEAEAEAWERIQASG